MKVRDIMRPARWTIGPGDTLGTAERIMARRRLHYLPVVDAGALVGILSERDVLECHARAKTNGDGWHMAVRHAMAEVPPTVEPDEPVATAVDRLAKSPVELLPVIEGGFLVGQLSATDLFEAERSPIERAAYAATVADAMTEPAVTVRPTDTLLAAARLMVDHQVRHLPVIDDDGMVIGMLSDRDLRTVAGDPVRFVESPSGNGNRSLAVRDAMTPNPLTVRDDRPLVELARELADEKVGALPVVDSEAALVGIVSYVDALRALAA
jgi:CBS domain-containing membrane protein